MASADVKKVLELKRQLKESTEGQTVLFCSHFSVALTRELKVYSTCALKTRLDILASLCLERANTACVMRARVISVGFVVRLKEGMPESECK